jgi:hypothetical protein
VNKLRRRATPGGVCNAYPLQEVAEYGETLSLIALQQLGPRSHTLGACIAQPLHTPSLVQAGPPSRQGAVCISGPSRLHAKGKPCDDSHAIE